MAGGSSGFQLTAVGSTEALTFPAPNSIMHGLQRLVHNTIWGILDSPSVLTWQMEASPDGTSWCPIVGFTGLSASRFNLFTGYVYAIRGTVLTYTSGKLTIFANWTL